MPSYLLDVGVSNEVSRQCSKSFDEASYVLCKNLEIQKKFNRKSSRNCHVHKMASLVELMNSRTIRSRESTMFEFESLQLNEPRKFIAYDAPTMLRRQRDREYNNSYYDRVTYVYMAIVATTRLVAARLCRPFRSSRWLLIRSD